MKRKGGTNFCKFCMDYVEHVLHKETFLAIIIKCTRCKRTQVIYKKNINGRK